MTATQKATIDALLRELGAAGHHATTALSGMMLEHTTMASGLRAIGASQGECCCRSEAWEIMSDVDSGTMGVAL